MPQAVVSVSVLTEGQLYFQVGRNASSCGQC